MTAPSPARTVGDVAELVRSKNAGPFWQTFDIFCADDAAYDELAADGVITPDRIGAIYRLDPAVVKVFRMPDIRAIKVSVPRPVSSGSARDRDVHAGQQHVPLLLLPVDVPPCGRGGVSVEPELVDRLRDFDTPTVSNAIDALGIRPTTVGYTRPPLQAITTDLPPIVGWAVTLAIRTVEPFASSDAQREAMTPLYVAMQAVDGPKIAVVADLDHQDGLAGGGCLWGEVNATLCLAMGCLGVVTDGLVRDVADVTALGFHYVARGVGVARGNTRVVATLEPVDVGGLVVTTGDLIHADRHGAILVPPDRVADVIAAAERISASEARLLAWARSAEFHPDQIAAQRARR